jgi:hypothetical protein
MQPTRISRIHPLVTFVTFVNIVLSINIDKKNLNGSILIHMVIW